MDSCRENLREYSHAKLPNVLFVIASAQNLPQELNGLVSHITVNFPWGSLLKILLDGEPKFIRGLESVSRSVTAFDLRLNGGALAEVGWSLETGAEQIYTNLIRAGWRVNNLLVLNAHALRDFPSTWAKRLAFGRDPRAITISGCIK